MDLTTGQTIIQELCQLLAEPKQLYQRASRRSRRTLNKAIFTRLYIDANEGSRPIVASDELSEHVAPLVHTARHRPHPRPPARPDSSSTHAGRGGRAHELRRSPAR